MPRRQCARAAGGRVLLIVLALAVASVAMQRAPVEAAVELDADERAALDSANAVRADAGAGALALSSTLQSAAEWTANDLAQRGFLSHTDSLGRDLRGRLDAFGYPSSTVIRENIAYGYATGASVVQGWVDSPPHYANLVADDVRVAGLALVRAGGSSYWVLVLGSVSDPTTTAQSTEPEPDATPASVAGSVPTSGLGFLVLDQSSSPDSVLSALAAGGCSPSSLWVSSGGMLVGYRPGAPSFVNAAFPGSLSAGTPFIVVCA